MPLADILEAIRKEADAEIERIETEASEQVAGIRRRVEDEAAAEEESRARGRDEAAERERARIVNQAGLEQERRLRQVREEMYLEAHGRMEKRLAGIRDGDGYRQVVASLLEEARGALPAASRVTVAAADQDLVSSLVAERNEEFDVGVGEIELGGLRLETDDGRVVDNTFESRIRKADPHLRQLAWRLVPALEGG